MNETLKRETKKCSSCDEDISAKAKKCPHCQHDLRSWLARHPVLAILLALIAVPFIFASFSSPSVEKEAPQPERKSELQAKVNFSDGQFTITNLEDQDCIDARLKLNDSYLLENYTLEAGSSYTVGAMQFAKKDGTRFNPFETNPQNFSINCQGHNGLTYAFWYGGW